MWGQDRTDPPSEGGPAALGRWQQLCARAIHPDLRANSEDRRRAELALLLALLLLTGLSVRIAFFFALGGGLQPWVGMLGALLMASAAVCLRYVPSMTVVGNLMTLGMLLPALHLTVIRGGFEAPMIMVLPLLPLCVTLLSGWRSGLAWTVLVMIVIVTFGWLAKSGVRLPDYYSPAAAFRLRFTGALVLSVAVFGIGLAYEWTKKAALAAELRAELQRSKAESDANMARADRLAAMGQLVAGVAHEINNPLTYVNESLDAIGDRLRAADAARFGQTLHDLEQAQVGLRRIQTIVRDLKTFTRPSELAEGIVDLRTVVEMSSRIIENEIRHKARLELDVPADLPKVVGNEAHIGQVVLNLLLNAAQAIDLGAPETNRIAVTARQEEQGSLRVEIADTGRGMSPDERERALEPFFTTKPVGVGTGLGLSVCANIVRSMGGELTLESTVGTGTTVRIRLPAERLHEGPGPVVPTAPPPTLEADRSYRVLIIDDDELVARAIGRLLRPHQVVIATSGEEGLRRLSEGDGFDAIFCDLMMPGLSGPDVHQHVVEHLPGTEKQMIFLTGGVFNDRVREFVDTVENRFLQKPVTREELTRVIADMANRHGNGLATSGLPH